VISFQGETKAYHGSVLVLVPHIDSSIILGRLGEKRSPTSFVESPVVSLSLTIECENNKVKRVFNMTLDRAMLPISLVVILLLLEKTNKKNQTSLLDSSRFDPEI
jgi:hypothetical protein